jgi:hypothetical protein
MPGLPGLATHLNSELNKFGMSNKMTTDDCYLAKNEKIGNKLVVVKDTM